MTWVKVCGLSKRRDVEAAEDAGADAIGLVLVPESPRAIRPDLAATLARSTEIDSYLLIRDATPAEMLDLADFVGVTGIQPYGSHREGCIDAALRAGLAVLAPVRVSDDAVSLAEVRTDVVPLVDAAVDGTLGGSGQRFDSGLVDAAGRDWVLAGGLDPENVGEAIDTAKPWGVDASSGLERSPGVKDAALIRRFVEEAKAT